MNLKRWISTAVLLAAAGLTAGQQPQPKADPPKNTAKPAAKEPAKPEPGSLEDTLEKALKNSADIRAAEAKVRDAEAEANRTRTQVLTKATTLHTNLRVAKRMLDVAQTLFAQTKAGVERGTVPQAEYLAAQTTLEKARGEVELLETELKSLRGEFAVKGVNSVAFSPEGLLVTGVHDGVVRVWDVGNGKAITDSVWLDSPGAFSPRATTPVAPGTTLSPMAERVRKLLDKEVEFVANGTTVGEAFKMLLEGTEMEIPFRMLLPEDVETITLKGKMPLGAWFQALEDTDPKLSIVVRDYGLLYTKKDRVPPSAVLASELWKAKPKEEPKPAGKN